MTDPEFHVRRMAPNEVGLIREWAAAEGWDPGLYDGPAFHAADPEGFFLGLLSETPVGCASAIRYGDGFGFFGQYIVRPPYRGIGYGLDIGRAGLAHLEGRNVGLDGVLDKVRTYERIGFRFAHYTSRYAGIGGGDQPSGLTPLADVPFAAVLKYDSMCFPAPREPFLREWVRLPESIGLAAMAKDMLTGYGVLRKTAAGYKVGPLFADDAETAARLLLGLIAAIPGQPFCIDLPDQTAQPNGGKLLQIFRLNEVFRTARMYTAGEPTFDRARVFGITTLELG